MALTPTSIQARAVRCFCADCGYAMSAMSIGALIDAQREHERYVQLTPTEALALVEKV